MRYSESSNNEIEDIVQGVMQFKGFAILDHITPLENTPFITHASQSEVSNPERIKLQVDRSFFVINAGQRTNVI